MSTESCVLTKDGNQFLPKQISACFQTSVELGQAKMGIKNKKRYKFIQETFLEFCQSSWGMSKTQKTKYLTGIEEDRKKLREKTA
jgi:hypothetical protein